MRVFSILLLLVLLLFAVAHPGYSQTTNGSILGDIVDSSGAALPGVAVSATSVETGAIRQTLTNAVGAYRLAALPPSEYEIRAQADGFRTVARAVVVLPIQGEIKIDFRMEVGSITESITVTADTPLVRPTDPAIQTVIDNLRVEALPLKTRDYMDLALLAPGVVLDQSSVRNSAGTDSISFFGLDESAKSIWLEGVDFNDEVTTGGTNISPAARSRLGQEAIQEFQVMATGYSAEFGRSGGGAINVVLKSGSNSIHGSAYYFLRDDAFDKPAFEVRGGVARPASTTSPVKRQSWGGTVGGPIVENRAFYFLSFERRTQDQNAEVSIPDEVKLFVDSLSLGYDTRTTVPQKRKQMNWIGKLSSDLNPSHRLNVSYVYDDDDDRSKNVSSFFGADHGFDDLNSSYFASANLTSLIGTNTVNEFRFNRSLQRILRTIPEGSSFLPALEFPSVSLGTDGGSTPQARVQKNWIIANTTSHQVSGHTIKWGGEVNTIDAVNDTNEQFNGTYRFPADTAPFVPDRYTAGFNLQFARGESSDPAATQISRDVDMYALFANDTWRLNSRLTLNLGLRYDLRVLQGDLGGPDAFSEPGFSRDAPEAVWLNVALGSEGALGVQPWRPIPTDTLDFSPRLGLAWDVAGDGRSVVRASYGIYHDRIPTVGLRSAVNSYNGLNIERVEVANPTFFPAVPDASGLPVNAVSSSTVPSPAAHTPHSQQFNVGLQYAIDSDMAFFADYTHLLVLHQTMRRNVNAPAAGGVCPFGSMLVARGFPECFRMMLSHDMSGRGNIDMLTLRLDRRFNRRLGFLIGYTLGSAEQFDRSGFLGIEPADPYDIFRPIDFGPMDNDVRHRITANAIVRLPYGISASTIVTANSAAPYNHVINFSDANDDGFALNDRPEGVGFNSLRGDAHFNTDLRFTKNFVLDEAKSVEVLWEMFNLFNTANLVNYQGVESSSTFGQARGALDPFQAQFGLKFLF